MLFLVWTAIEVEITFVLVNDWLVEALRCKGGRLGCSCEYSANAGDPNDSRCARLCQICHRFQRSRSPTCRRFLEVVGGPVM